MASGYDQFFKQAKDSRAAGSPASNSKSKRNGRNRSRIKDKGNKAAKQSAKSHATHQQSEPTTPEQALKQLLNDRRANRIAKRSKLLKVPLVPMLALGLIVSLLGWFMIEPERIDQVLSRVEIGWYGDAKAAGSSSDQEKASKSKGLKAEKSAATAAGKTTEQAQAKTNWTEKDISHFSKLNERKTELDLREGELEELEEELHKQKEEIEARINKLQTVREQIAGILKERVQIDEKKVNKLVDVYSNMKAKQAAEILGSINEDLAVEILGRMKKKNAAAILNLLKASKAQDLSEKFAGYKRR